MKLTYSTQNNKLRAHIDGGSMSEHINHTREMVLNDIIKLLKNKPIECFDISYSSLTNEEASIIIDPLSKNSHIIDIDISNNSLDHNIAKAIYENFINHKKLKKINISDNYIGDEGIISMSKLIYSNKTITALHISNIGISCDGIAALSNAVNLKKLTLSGNKISTKGINIIANNLLKDNRALIKLDLSNNIIGDEDVKLLFEVLINNDTMKKLILYNNNITNKGAYNIADFLSINSVIEKLPLYSNKIGNVGGEAILKALTYNKNILSINLICNNISDHNIILSVNKITKENMSRKYKSKINSLIGEDVEYKNDKNSQYVQVETIGDNCSFKYGEVLDSFE